MSKSLENLPERRPSSDEVDPSASTEPPRCCKKGRRSTGAFPENVFLGGAALGEHFSGVFRGHEKGRPVRRPVRCGLWQRLVGHVHRDAGDGADGLAAGSSMGRLMMGIQLDGLIGARLGGNVLKQVARWHWSTSQSSSMVEKRTALMWPRRWREMFTGEMSMR